MNGDDDRSRDDAEKVAMKRTVREYRAAAEALDERPSTQARTAILAAAAREVGARPHKATSPGAPVTPTRQNRSMLRWPMAAAATVLLSSLAVMMAQRVEQHAQTDAEIAAPAAPATDSRAAMEQPAIAPSPVDAVAEKPAAPAIAVPRSSSPPRPQRPDERAPDARSAEAARERSVAQSEPSASAPPVAPVPAAPPSPDLPSAPSAAVAGAAAPFIAQSSPRAAAADADAARRQEARPKAAESASREARSEAALGAVQRPGSAPAEAEDGALSASDWLARIIRLREAGRHAEADAQLQRFRQHYPQVKVPEQALHPAGTR